MKDVYYITYDDAVYSQDEIKRSFYLNTGKNADEHLHEYIKYLNGCFGKSLKGYFPGTVENLIAHSCKVRAIALYRKENSCTLSEARAVIEDMMSKNNLST